MNIGIIGYGSMGKMILGKFIETKTIGQSKLFVSNRTYEKIMDLNKYYPQLNICKNNIDTAKNADIVFICVKPLEIKTVLSEIINDIKDNCHIISILTSCMPGFIGAMFKVITDEAEKHTALDKKQIMQMVIETVYGTRKLLSEKGMTFDDLINRVATKGGITEEGTKIIEEKLPGIINEMFVKTLEKRKIITEKAQNEFV